MAILMVMLMHASSSDIDGNADADIAGVYA